MAGVANRERESVSEDATGCRLWAAPIAEGDASAAGQSAFQVLLDVEVVASCEYTAIAKLVDAAGPARTDGGKIVTPPGGWLRGYPVTAALVRAVSGR